MFQTNTYILQNSELIFTQLFFLILLIGISNRAFLAQFSFMVKTINPYSSSICYPELNISCLITDSNTLSTETITHIKNIYLPHGELYLTGNGPNMVVVGST